MKLLKFITWVFCPIFILTVFESHKEAKKIEGAHPLENFTMSRPFDLTKHCVAITVEKKVEKAEVVVKKSKRQKQKVNVKYSEAAHNLAILPERIKVPTLDTLSERIKRLSHNANIFYRKQGDTNKTELKHRGD